ncbi:hypothetical protein [Flavobacterium sp.]|uniref:hypothetical protein n=1 Tax=Flavobacterium sp. TaxID=239 RepID=UPI003B9DA35D
MKKLFSTSKYKKRNRQKSFAAVKQHNKRKQKYFRSKYYSKSTNRTRKGRYFRTYNREPKITVQIAPQDFSIVNNAEETLAYFDYVQFLLNNDNSVMFDISKIQTLTTDAIAVLLAKIQDEKFHMKNEIYGNEPENEYLKKLFTQSGFYEHVLVKEITPKNDKKLLIHKQTNNRVEPDIAKEACLLGLRHTFENEEIFEPLYDILIEAMQNTNNHAGSERGKYDWWLHVYNHPGCKRTSYTFLDLGVGIFESLPVKTYKREFYENLGIPTNLELVPRLFAGAIKSRTARPERGKGVPQIYECAQDPAFIRFILISNDIFADMKNNQFLSLRNKFDGTLFYWEINN